MGELRTLQRRIKLMAGYRRSGTGSVLRAGASGWELCESDFTHLTELGIIHGFCGEPFSHMLYHFVLLRIRTGRRERSVYRRRVFALCL